MPASGDRGGGLSPTVPKGLVSFKVTLALGSASVALVSGLVPVAWGPDSTTPAESLSPRKVTSPGMGIKTVFISSGCRNKAPQTGVLKKRSREPSHSSQRPAVRDQALPRQCSLCRCWDSVLSACSGPCRPRYSVVAALSHESSASTSSSSCVHVSKLSLLIEIPVVLDQGPPW